MVDKEDKLAQKFIQGCLRNEKESQYGLYKHFYGFAMGICLRYTSDRSDAAAVLNDGFFKVFVNIDKYDPSKPFIAWLGKIMSNTAIDHYRSNLKFSDSEDINEYEHLGHDSGIYGKLAYDDLIALIRKLSPAYRTVFNLFAIDGYTHEEIGEILNISVGTSKSNLFKARQKLQEMLKLHHQKSTEIKYGEEANLKLNIKT